MPSTFTFHHPLILNHIPLPHIQDPHNLPIYQTNIPCEKPAVFHAPMVVTMTPIPPHHVTRSVQLTSPFPSLHPPPIHIPDPPLIPISHLNHPHFPQPSVIKQRELPVFSPCPVTP
ncbi:D-glutamate cyclase family protein, partial [Bacillus sp. WP8]|uniref:D-glutamate cyclase family protein n=1 Tax=Bacillus sp. WP8 TaxID=756828 RepID=UPI0037BF23F2